MYVLQRFCVIEKHADSLEAKGGFTCLLPRKIKSVRRSSGNFTCSECFPLRMLLGKPHQLHSPAN